MDALVEPVLEEPGLHLVAATRDSTEAIALAEQHRPDVLLLDVMKERGLRSS